MSKKKNLLNLFTKDVIYNYHLIKTEDPNGHLIYIIKNGSALDKTLLEFYPTHIAEELINECNVKIEKFAPSIFFTEEENIEKLKYELNEKLSEDFEFSAFIEEIKDEYRALEVKDSLLYKRDPEAYKAAKEVEHIEHQKELWEKMVEQFQDKKTKREETLSKYNNDLIKLLKEYLESIIEYEKRDFNLIVELEKFIGNLIDPETWIKVEDKPFICRVEPISLETDRMNVFLTDNNDYSYTATLRFDKHLLITENVLKINKEDSLPNCIHDYEFLAQLYDVDISNVPEWKFKNDTDKFEYVIDYLAPIFKAEKEKRQKESIDKVLAKKGKTDVSELEDEDFDDLDEDENNEPVSQPYVINDDGGDDNDDDKIIGSHEPRLVKIFNDNHPRTEMSKDEMMIFMGMIMSKDESLKLCVDELDKESKIYKELKPLFEGFQLKIFLKRLELLTSLRITVGAFVILSQYFSNAGVAVMYAYYLHQMLPANTIVDVHVISEELFPWGFFSAEQLTKMWDEQKVQLKDELDECTCHGAPDNLLDYNESWQK